MMSSLEDYSHVHQSWFYTVAWGTGQRFTSSHRLSLSSAILKIVSIFLVVLNPISIQFLILTSYMTSFFKYDKKKKVSLTKANTLTSG